MALLVYSVVGVVCALGLTAAVAFAVAARLDRKYSTHIKAH